MLRVESLGTAHGLLLVVGHELPHGHERESHAVAQVRLRLAELDVRAVQTVEHADHAVVLVESAHTRHTVMKPAPVFHSLQVMKVVEFGTRQ